MSRCPNRVRFRVVISLSMRVHATAPPRGVLLVGDAPTERAFEGWVELLSLLSQLFEDPDRNRTNRTGPPPPL